MKPLPHNYEVALTGAPSGYATATGFGLPDLTTAPPAEYDGPGDAWSPEHLLLAAVSACFVFTFRAVARASQVEFIDIDARTSGTVGRSEGTTRFTDIVVHAAVTPAAGVDAAAVQRAVDKTAARCLVTSSLLTPVRVEATIRDAATAGVAA
jgi:organic hydroperoxide reductase OsmC/OhrA